VEPALEAGVVGLCPGPYMAASDVFGFTLSGSGGHGSRPQDVTDVISAACDSVGMLNTIISRKIPAEEQVVISVCNIRAGNTYNVLPTEAAFGGTVRTFSRARAEMVREALNAGADIIMLDNMDTETMKQAVEMIGNRALTECSGNVTVERLRELSGIGVDYISSGALTHSYSSLDLSLRFTEE
jgi:metal-dependent amidase/aminoacylase/carboxypeptidase family protein